MWVNGEINYEYWQSYTMCLDFAHEKIVLDDINLGKRQGSALLASVAESVIGI